MYDSLQGVLPRDAFRGAAGRGRSTWSNSPGALRAFAPVLYAMGHLVRPRSSSRNAQLMGKRKKRQKHFERDGWEEDFEIWSDMIWAPMIYSFFHILWFPPQELVRGSQHCQQPLVTVRSFPPSARQRLFWQNWAFVGRSWWEWLKCFLMCCFGVCFITKKTYLALQPAVPSCFIHPFRPISWQHMIVRPFLSRMCHDQKFVSGWSSTFPRETQPLFAGTRISKNAGMTITIHNP